MNLKIITALLSASFAFLGCQKELLSGLSTEKVPDRGVTPTSNAAPSMHLNQYFNQQTILKMQKIKVVQTGLAEFFMVNNFTGGYSGIQHTIDSANYATPTSKVLIASLWDTNTSQAIHANYTYLGTNTLYSRFGGEGDGAKTMNPFNWKVGTWYNVVNRGWYSNGKLFVATYIQDLGSGTWFHTSTLNRPEPNGYLGDYNDSFLEDWVGNDDRMDGRYTRKAFFKDCWGLNSAGNWVKPNSRNISVNDGQADVNRNGIYHNSYDGGYNASEDAFYMAHGAGITPSAEFNGTRNRSLPSQTNQGTTPSIGTTTVNNLTATYNGSNNLTVNWNIPNTSVPQFSSKVEILNSANVVVATINDTIPDKRSSVFNLSLPAGNYVARLTVQDIFNRIYTPITT